MRRVEIEGQFDPSNPWNLLCTSGNPEPFRVARQQISAHEQPSNFNAFCDEVDSSLQKLAKAKYASKISGLLIFGVIAFCVVSQIVLRVFVSGDGFRIAYVSIPAVIIINVIFIFKNLTHIRSVLRGVFNEVADSCKKYSIPNNVTYEVHDEWWGGCSKHHTRRRFLKIDLIATNDIEQQSQLFQHEEKIHGTTPIPEKFDDHKKIDDKPSLFDELKSGL